MLSSTETRRVAAAGLILGILGLGLTSLLALNSAREKARHANCASNVEEIGLACRTYAESHNGKLPRDFDDLNGLILDHKVYFCPSAKDQTHYSYAFTGLTNVWGVGSN